MTTDYATGTRSAILFILAVAGGVATQLVYDGPDQEPPTGVPVPGLLGFAACAVAALMLGALISRVAQWWDSRRVGR